MNAITTARNSNAMRLMQQEVPVLRASSLGDDAFVDFNATQARSPIGAQLVVNELESREKAGFRLDRILKEVLNVARATLRRHSELVAAFH